MYRDKALRFQKFTAIVNKNTPIEGGSTRYELEKKLKKTKVSV